MGENLWGVRGDLPSLWDFRDCAVGRDQEVCVDQGIGHVCQRLRKRAETLGGVYPPHWQDQVDADNFSLLPWCRWDDVRKHAHLRWLNGAAVVCVCDVQFETWTRPWTGSASHTACRMRGKARPNCIESGTDSLSVVSLTLGVSESSCAKRSRIRRGRR